MLCLAGSTAKQLMQSLSETFNLCLPCLTEVPLRDRVGLTRVNGTSIPPKHFSACRQIAGRAKLQRLVFKLADTLDLLTMQLGLLPWCFCHPWML